MSQHEYYYNGKKYYYCSFYFTDWQGKRKQKKKTGFLTKKEAKAWQDSFLEKVAGLPTMSFRSLWELYDEDMKKHVKTLTAYNRECIAKKYFLPYIGELPINEITPATIRHWQGKIKEFNFSEHYQHTINGVLSCVLNHAVKYYHLSNNPVKISGSIGNTHKKSINYWTPAEYNIFRSYFHEKDTTEKVYRLIFDMLYYGGFRVGELLAVTPADVDFNENKINVNKTYHRYKRQDLIETPKTVNSYRAVDMPASLMKIVKWYISIRPELRKKDRLFECITERKLDYYMDKVIKAKHLKRIKRHDLRHSHVSFLIDRGFSPVAVKERLGHKDIRMTLNTYSHLFESKKNDIVNSLENLFTGKLAAPDETPAAENDTEK